MEFLNEKSGPVEIHVRLTRSELRDLIQDMINDCSGSDPYDATEKFMEYLKGL